MPSPRPKKVRSLSLFIFFFLLHIIVVSQLVIQFLAEVITQNVNKKESTILCVSSCRSCSGGLRIPAGHSGEAEGRVNQLRLYAPALYSTLFSVSVLRV